MVIYGRSLMATKADNRTSINGLGLPTSKGPFRPLACCPVRSVYECYQETRCTRPWQSSHITCGLLFCMGLAPVPRKECLAVSLTSPKFGWLPLAAALFGTQEWKPQWLHHNFLPVVGLRLHAKVPPPPLSQAQLILLCGLWQRKEQSEPSCTSLQQAAHLKFGLPLPFREMAK